MLVISWRYWKRERWSGRSGFLLACGGLFLTRSFVAQDRWSVAFNLYKGQLGEDS
jgi:hypothetical protein